MDSNGNDAPINSLTRDELHKIQNSWDLPNNLKASKDSNLEEMPNDLKTSQTAPQNQTVENALSEKFEKTSDSLLGKRKKIFQVETVKTDKAPDHSSDEGLMTMMDDREEEEASREVTSSKVRKTSDEVAATEENLFNNEAAATSSPDQNQSNILSLLKEIKDNQLKF